jgi:uncharacterized membrane protein
MLFATFLVRVIAAHGINMATLGPESPRSIRVCFAEVFTTGAGWTLIVVDCVAGFFFASAVLAASAISFPLLPDRQVGIPAAVVTSIRVTSQNLRVMAVWGCIVAAGSSWARSRHFSGSSS